MELAIDLNSSGELRDWKTRDHHHLERWLFKRDGKGVERAQAYVHGHSEDAFITFILLNRRPRCDSTNSRAYRR